MLEFDNNYAGDGWDEIGCTYSALAASTAVVGGVMSLTGNPAGPLFVIAARALTVVSVGACGIDAYGMKSDLR